MKLVPAPSGPPLGFLLSAAGFAAAARFKARLEPFGLDPREFNVLRSVAMEEGISQQSCGEALGVRPNAMVGLVDRLEEKGLVERRPNPRDRRARALHVTPAGRKVLQRTVEGAARDGSALVEGLTEQEQQQLQSLLLKVMG